MKIKLFDSHCHLDFPGFDKDRQEVLSRMRERGVFGINVGANRETSVNSVKLAQENENIFATVGVHPTDAVEEGFSAEDGPAVGWDYEFYKNLAKNKKVVGIGETGLDYFRSENSQTRDKTQETRDKQKELFEQHIKLAIGLNLPLVVHIRPSKNSADAFEDVLKILNTYFQIPNTKSPGVVHFFSGDWGIARQFLDLGFYLGFDGPITFTNQYDEVIKNTPLEKILVETDSPFAAPAPYRGKRNEPIYVNEVAKKIAQVKEEPPKKVAEQTTENTCRLFGLNLPF